MVARSRVPWGVGQQLWRNSEVATLSVIEDTAFTAEQIGKSSNGRGASWRHVNICVVRRTLEYAFCQLSIIRARGCKRDQRYLARLSKKRKELAHACRGGILDKILQHHVSQAVRCVSCVARARQGS